MYHEHDVTVTDPNAIPRGWRVLPASVRRYLAWAGARGRKPITHVHLRHGGTFRTALNGKWRPITGELQLTPEPPGRVWQGVIKPFPLMSITGHDAFVHGVGTMVIKVFSRIPIARSTGPAMDKSGLVTVLAELPFAPSALGSKRLDWEPIDESSARATLRYKALKVSGVFHFEDGGRIVRFETDDRFREVDKKLVRTRWVVHYRRYEEIGGWHVPVEFDAAWRFDDCEMSYARFCATSIEFNASSGG